MWWEYVWKMSVNTKGWSLSHLLRGPESAFSLLRCDSLHRFTWNLAWTRNTWDRLAVRNFTSIGAREWVCGPRVWQFLFYTWSDSLHITSYKIIAEKARVSHLPRIFPCTLKEKLCVGSKNDWHLLEWSRRPVTPCKVWRDQSTRAGCRCENVNYSEAENQHFRPAGADTLHLFT